MALVSELRIVDQIVSVGSVDGILTTAALLRLIGKENVGLEFTQAFTVDKVDLAKWAPGRHVALVDLAVNNRDPKMTLAFIARVRETGHTLVAVIDEHSREDWLVALGSFDGLIITPNSQDAGEYAPKSSGEVLRRALSHEAGLYEESIVDADWYPEIDREAAIYQIRECTDPQVLELLAAADAGDRMDFTTHFGGLVNKSVKSAIADDTRRVYMARHFAANREADSTIQKWIKEYEEILANHQEILVAKKELGDGIVRVVATGKKIDMTTLMSTLYKGGARVVALEGEAFNKSLSRKTVQIAFGTDDKSVDLLSSVKAAVPTASGFAQKVNVDPEHETAALAAIRAVIKG